MNRAIALASIFFSVGLPVCQEGLYAQAKRTWTDGSGRSIVAEYLGIEGKGDNAIVLIRRDDGKEFRFPVSRLSQKDRDYLDGLESPSANLVKVEIPDSKIEPFLRKFCFRCHDADVQNGQVRLDRLQFEITNNDQAQRWQDILDQLNGGEMPPEDEPQPGNEALAEILGELTRSLLLARRRLSDQGGASG
ncbi:MAG: c-type cytochrome domain-containing protein [Planctomycetota bacterium]|nr:c-type cytochrome domain-containing protein [Planctomycetota bacterium]